MNKKIFTTWLILFAAFFISSNFAVSQTTNFWEPTSGPANTEVWSFAVGSSNVVWVGTNSGVFMSTNNGDVWTAKNNGLVSTLIGVGGETGGIPLLIRALAVNSSGHIFAGTAEGLFRSTDVGNNWTKVLPDLNIRSIVISSSGKIYVGIENRTASDPDAGVYLSIDNGNTWTKKNEGLFNLFVKSLAITSDGTILAGTSGSGVFRSTDGGDNWLLPANNADVVVEALTIASDGTIYAATNQSPYKGVIKSTDKGNTWNQANNGLNDLQVNAIVFNSSNSHIFNGTYSQGVFRTTDAGANWYKINNGLPPISNGDNIVRSFTVNSAGVMFAGTKGSGVYRSIIFTTPILYTDKDTLVYTAAWGAALPASQQFLITNVGTGTLNWSAAKSAAWFDISPTSGVNNGLVTVSINSTTVLAPGTYYQNITLTAPGAGASSPHNVVVKYIVTGPGISVISPLNFGNVALGSYKDSTLTITNTGNATLTITSAPNFNINGTDASMFTIQGSITYPINITAGNSRTFTIRFTPASIGAKTAKLSITDNVPITPLTEVVLLGNGVTPQINIDPLNINFGNVNLGLLKDSVVSISSVGNSKLTINNLQLIGTDASSFSFTSPTLPYDITIGSVYSLPVRFSPTTLGNKSALLIISHNATGSPDTVTLSGNGVQPQILITPDTLDFGDVFTGNWKELSFKITNSGSAPLIISSVIKSGIDISQFSR